VSAQSCCLLSQFESSRYTCNLSRREQLTESKYAPPSYSCTQLHTLILQGIPWHQFADFAFPNLQYCAITLHSQEIDVTNLITHSANLLSLFFHGVILTVNSPANTRLKRLLRLQVQKCYLNTGAIFNTVLDSRTLEKLEFGNLSLLPRILLELSLQARTKNCKMPSHQTRSIWIQTCFCLCCSRLCPLCETSRWMCDGRARMKCSIASCRISTHGFRR
jgi:hypothetical protein